MTIPLPVLRVGQTVELTTHLRNPLTRAVIVRTITARVDSVEPAGHAPGGTYFTFPPLCRFHENGAANRHYLPENGMAGAWGAETLRPAPKPFGLQALRILRDARA